jgi:drug/metabolite transporter (DMT)-like permease
MKLQTGQGISILYLALICSCVGYFMWNFALSRLEAVKAAVWLYIEPVAAFIGEALIFNLMPTPLTLTGGGAIILGALITSRSRK